MLRALGEARAIAGGRALMADATQSFRLERLRPMARPLAELALDWLEEPFLADDIIAYMAWRDEAVRPPVALGENCIGLDGFRRVLADVSPECCSPTSPRPAASARVVRLPASSVRASAPACTCTAGRSGFTPART